MLFRSELETARAWSNIYATLDNATISIAKRVAVKVICESLIDLFDSRVAVA